MGAIVPGNTAELKKKVPAVLFLESVPIPHGTDPPSVAISRKTRHFDPRSR